MQITVHELVELAAAISAILMLGPLSIRHQASLNALQSLFIASATLLLAYQQHKWQFYIIGVTLILERVMVLPAILKWVADKYIDDRATNTVEHRKPLPAPLSVLSGIALSALGCFLAMHLPQSATAGSTLVFTPAAVSLSLLFSGFLMMLARRQPLSQIVGFITLENGAYVFALAQTNGPPMLIEASLLFDIFIVTVLAFIVVSDVKQTSVQLDVTQLPEAKSVNL